MKTGRKPRAAAAGTMEPNNTPDGTYGAVVDVQARERALLAGVSRAIDADGRRIDSEYTTFRPCLDARKSAVQRLWA